MKPVVDAFHFGVGHGDLIIVVVLKVKYFGVLASLGHSHRTCPHDFLAGEQYAVPLVL